MAPLFSIITVCLNAGDTLKSTIDSIVSQNYTDYESIIKDGGSSDDCFDFLSKDEKYSNIKLTINPDKGIYDAMNQALELCVGKYVLFLNAGDIFHNDGVLKEISEVANQINSPDLIYSDYITTNLNMTQKYPSRLNKSFLYGTTICHQVCYIKKKCYAELGNFNTKFKVLADYDFLLRLLTVARSSFRYLPIVTAISLSDGYSYINHKIAQKELRTIRDTYFNSLSGYMYGFFYFFTLPKLRIYLMRNQKPTRLKKIYVCLLAFYYKYIRT